MPAPRKLKWAVPPTTPDEFEQFMQAVDAVMFERAVPIAWRHYDLPSILREVFRWKDPYENLCGFAAPENWLKARIDLLTQMETWYREVYEVDPTQEYAYISALKLGNNLWHVTLPIGAVGNLYVHERPFVALDYRSYWPPEAEVDSVNVLSFVNGLTQPAARRVSTEELDHFVLELAIDSNALAFIDELQNNTATKLFTLARADRNVATTALVAGQYAQAAWATQQATEKLLKGLLTVKGIRYPTKGGEGHDIINLAQLLAPVVVLNPSLLKLTNWQPAVRYGELPCDLHSVYQAHRAFHHLLIEVMASRAFDDIGEGHFEIWKCPDGGGIQAVFEEINSPQQSP